MDSPERTDGRVVTIFEAVNTALRQSYLAMTTRPLDETLIELQQTPPREISAWRWDRGGISLGELTKALPVQDAVKFAATYAESLRASGWTVIVGPLSDGSV